MPLPLSDDGGSTLIEFSGASIGKYLESALGSGTQKLMYVVDVIGAKDKTNRQAFFHANKAKGTTRQSDYNNKWILVNVLYAPTVICKVSLTTWSKNIQ